MSESPLDEDFQLAESDLDDEFLEEDGSDSSTLALFDGDTGGLSLGQRRALVALMKNRFISSSLNPAEWRAIREDPAPIKARLNDMFLDLHVDLSYEVAFKRQAASDSGTREFPTLLHDTQYTREETIALVFLRHRFQNERASGHEDVTIERDDLITHIASFRPSHATDRSGDRSRTDKAVENLMKAKVLSRTNDSARLRISPVIAVLLPLPRLHELWEWLKNENGTTGSDDEND
ncbi:DUF4194 domain-containing protein [Lentzea terrae]|uniref:DUF4194 domain-containing protein n=1 Tax=Lentzea terrae TaxID=2200761 RepID=UPI000DD407FD|nr:DUF4194 domain-containing protein [Lentzea terrae]